MAANTLTKLVKAIAKPGNKSSLNKKQARAFYQGVSEAITPVIKEIRDEEKKAYEVARHVTLA